MNAFQASDRHTLATRFASESRVLRGHEPLNEDQMRRAAPSIFATGKHTSRSERYTYIPTIEVLRALRREGFEPFMVAQGSSRIEGKAEYTKHMIRLRSGGEMFTTKPDVNEIILINSHDGASSYALMAGTFRFVCSNGLVVGDVVNDIRIPHKGHVERDVIEGAFRVVDDFKTVDASKDAMKALTLEPNEEIAFATAALALRFGDRAVEEGGHQPAPVTADQLNEARRVEDVGHTLWATMQRVSENVMRGGQEGRSVQGHRLRTRPITAIDRSVSVNRALWTLAEEMRRIKAAG